MEIEIGGVKQRRATVLQYIEKMNKVNHDAQLLDSWFYDELRSFLMYQGTNILCLMGAVIENTNIREKRCIEMKSKFNQERAANIPMMLLSTEQPAEMLEIGNEQMFYDISGEKAKKQIESNRLYELDQKLLKTLYDTLMSHGGMSEYSQNLLRKAPSFKQYLSGNKQLYIEDPKTLDLKPFDAIRKFFTETETAEQLVLYGFDFKVKTEGRYLNEIYIFLALLSCLGMSPEVSVRDFNTYDSSKSYSLSHGDLSQISHYTKLFQGLEKKNQGLVIKILRQLFEIDGVRALYYQLNPEPVLITLDHGNARYTIGGFLASELGDIAGCCDEIKKMDNELFAQRDSQLSERGLSMLLTKPSKPKKRKKKQIIEVVSKSTDLDQSVALDNESAISETTNTETLDSNQQSKLFIDGKDKESSIVEDDQSINPVDFEESKEDVDESVKPEKLKHKHAKKHAKKAVKAIALKQPASNLIYVEFVYPRALRISHDKLIQKSQQPIDVEREADLDEFLTRLFNNDANNISYDEFKKYWERIGGKIQGESNGGSHRHLIAPNGQPLWGIFDHGGFGKRTCPYLQAAFVWAGYPDTRI